MTYLPDLRGCSAGIGREVNLHERPSRPPVCCTSRGPFFLTRQSDSSFGGGAWRARVGVRLPPLVHGDGDHGFVPTFMGTSRGWVRFLRLRPKHHTSDFPAHSRLGDRRHVVPAREANFPEFHHRNPPDAFLATRAP